MYRQAFALTPVQEKIFVCVGMGKNDQHIAALLHMSPRTVRNYVHALRQELKVKNRTHVAVRAWQMGYVDSTTFPGEE